MHVEHEFTFDDVLSCPHAFGILDDGLPCLAVSINEVGDVRAGPFKERTRCSSLEVFSTFAILRRYEFILYLLSQVCNNTSTLHHLQGSRTIMLLFGSMTTDTLCAVFIATLARESFVFVNLHCWRSNCGGTLLKPWFHREWQRYSQSLLFRSNHQRLSLHQ